MPAFSARSPALDGVSWDRAAGLKTQSAGDAAGYKIHAVVCSLLWASLLAELDAVSCLSGRQA
jgi:hypothetical protein